MSNTVIIRFVNCKVQVSHGLLDVDGLKAGTVATADFDTVDEVSVTCYGNRQVSVSVPGRSGVIAHGNGAVVTGDDDWLAIMLPSLNREAYVEVTISHALIGQFLDVLDGAAR